MGQLDVPDTVYPPPPKNREEQVAAAYSGTRPVLPEIRDINGNVFNLDLKRRPTALAVEIMRCANNFLVTGDRGLRAIGIEDPMVLSEYLDAEEAQERGLDTESGLDHAEHNHEDKKEHKNCPACQGLFVNPGFDGAVALGMVPPLVQAIILMRCSDDDLDRYDESFSSPLPGQRPGAAFFKDARDFLNKFSPGEIMKCLNSVDAEFKKISASMGKVVEENQGPPKPPGEE